MAKQSLLLVDNDTKNLRVLEVSLRKAGFNVTTALNGQDALSKVHSAAPDLIISDTRMPAMDGFELVERLKQNQDTAQIPFMFLTDRADIEDKIRGLELGVEEYLTKPIYIKEILTRIRILLQKRERLLLEEHRRESRTKFSGQLSDMAVVDLIQTIEVSRKSGLIHFRHPGGELATIFFRGGKVIDAEVGKLRGEDAVYRLLIWNDGEFEVEFKNIRQKEVIDLSSQALLMEGMRRVDEWSRFCEQVPPLDTVFEVDYRELGERLAEIPDEINGILRLIDGKRTIMQVIEEVDFADLDALSNISKLYFEGLVQEKKRANASEDSTNEVAEELPELEGWLAETSSDIADTDPKLSYNFRELAKNEAVPEMVEPVTTKRQGTLRVSATTQELDEQALRDEVQATTQQLLREVARLEESLAFALEERPRTSGQMPAVQADALIANSAVVLQFPAVGDDAPGRSARNTPLGLGIPQLPKDLPALPSSAVGVVVSDAARSDLAVVRTAAYDSTFEFDDRKKIHPELSHVAQLDLPDLIELDQEEAYRDQAHKTGQIITFLVVLAVLALTGLLVRSSVHRSSRANRAVVTTAAPPIVAPKPAPPTAVVTPQAPVEAPAAVDDKSEYDILVEQGRRLVEQGKAKSALPFLEQATQVNPNGDVAFVLLSRCYLDRGDARRALSTANLAIELNETSADGYLVVGAAQQQLHQNRLAKAAYQQYLALSPTGSFASEVRSILATLK